MQPGQTKSARTPLSLFAAAALAAIAMLALAGPAAAHHGHDGKGKRHHHGKKHHKRFHHKTLDGGQGAAGTITSFDPGTGRLTIALAGGDSVSGLVTEETWIDDGDGCDGHDWGDHDWDRRHLHGWDDDGDHDGWGDEGRGSTDDLVPGAVVEEAILAIGGGRAVFVKIELEDDDS